MTSTVERSQGTWRKSSSIALWYSSGSRHQQRARTVRSTSLAHPASPQELDFKTDASTPPTGSTSSLCLLSLPDIFRQFSVAVLELDC